MLHEGDPAPEIQLETDTGEPFTLSAHRGERIVLYFFPRADTPGCTTESCEFRDHSQAFTGRHTLVLGISPDTPKAQANFKTKYGLNFTLLCDVEKKAAKDYGVLKEKNMYGKMVMGIERTTFLIGEDGRLEKIFAKVKPAGHAEEILAVLNAV